MSIRLNNDGGIGMNDATKDNVGRSMAILFIEQKPRSRVVVVDGEETIERYTEEERRLISVATIQSALGFNFRITGLDIGEARDLALLLRAGALAAPMYIVEERTVGASLGEENIERGRQSVVAGFILVLVFMLVYYKWFGLAADIALTANLMLLIAVMSVLGATLTLPGIAGIVLTVGMAVDANVLIFSPHQGGTQEPGSPAGHTGGLRPGDPDDPGRQHHDLFRRHHPVLHRQRAGQGLCRHPVGWHRHLHVHRHHGHPGTGEPDVRRAQPQGPANMKLPIFDFMGKRRIAGIASVSAVVLSVGFLVFKGLNLGLDFTGGTLVEVGFERTVDAVAVRTRLQSAGFVDGVVQQFGTDRDILIRMPPQPGTDQAMLGDRILAAIREDAPGAVMRQSNFVGPVVGEELAESAGLAILTALGVVMLYILFRFTKQFAVGAVVALAHDVAVVLGIFSIFGWNFDLPVVAAILAVVGYSLNDTIVVSDRIRENFRTIRKGSSVDVINTSLNQILGRTLVTSLTTLFVLLALLIAGGEGIRGFAAALTIGVVIGTYSSIYVAANVLVLMHISREDLVVPEKERDKDTYP